MKDSTQHYFMSRGPGAGGRGPGAGGRVMSALQRRGHRKFSASPPESERAAGDNAPRSGFLPPFRFVSSAARVAAGVPPVARGSWRSLTLQFLCLPLLFAFAVPANAQTLGFTKSGASIDEATQGSVIVHAPVALNPRDPNMDGVVVDLEIVTSESTATRNVDYRLRAPTCRIEVGLCFILFSPIYTANCELDETVVLRMTGNSDGLDIDPARNTFTIKILETLDDSARFPNGHLYTGSANARKRCEADGIDWKQNNTPLNQGDSLESQDDQHSLQSEDGNDQQQADYSKLKSRVKMWAGEQDANSDHAQRWNRVLAALGDQDAIHGGYSPMTASEAQTYADNGWTRWDDVVTALSEIESRVTAEAQTETEPEPEPEPEPVACVSDALEDKVEDYSEESHNGAAHVERWLRVLQTFKGTANDSTIMLSSEAQTYVDRGWNRWIEVRDAIQCLEDQAL